MEFIVLVVITICMEDTKTKQLNSRRTVKYVMVKKFGLFLIILLGLVLFSSSSIAIEEKENVIVLVVGSVIVSEKYTSIEPTLAEIEAKASLIDRGIVSKQNPCYNFLNKICSLDCWGN